MVVYPQKPLPLAYADLLHRVINRNGIHIVYPLGRQYGVSLPGTINMFDGFTVRVIGYTIDPGPVYEIAIGGSDRVAYALMKWYEYKPLALLKPSSGASFSKEGNQPYYYSDYYSFAVRARHDLANGPSYQTIEFETALNAVAFSWHGANHWETLQYGTNVHLSKHCYDDLASDFPAATGLDPYLNFVQMEVGSIAHFSGIYSGPDEIRVISPGAVRDLGKPVHAGVSIRIAVTKTLNNFTFLADYATEPVVATYNDLVIVGHEFVPHFTMNFNIRHVYVEVYTE